MNTPSLKHVNGFSGLAIMALLIVALIAGQARGNDPLSVVQNDESRHDITINLSLRADDESVVLVEHTSPK
jgi:hypothetical protein